jgi:hypothetical protein
MGIHVRLGRRKYQIPAHERERSSVAGLHALGLPERRSTEQRLAGAGTVLIRYCLNPGVSG